MASKQKRSYKSIAAKSQRKITDHIFHRGHQSNFEVTPGMVLYWWRVLNKAVFDGILHPPTKIICRNFRNGDLGHCTATNGKKDDVHIAIRRQQYDRETFLTVLVHEMVHQYEWVTHKSMSHGKTFNAWVNTIDNAIGLPLGEYIE